LTATIADDTAVLTTQDPAIATHIPGTNLNKIQLWLKKWRMKANELVLCKIPRDHNQSTVIEL